MTDQWNKIIHSGKKFWIIRKGDSYEYNVVKKPATMFNDGRTLESFSAISADEAVKKGLDIAKKYSL